MRSLAMGEMFFFPWVSIAAVLASIVLVVASVLSKGGSIGSCSIMSAATFVSGLSAFTVAAATSSMASLGTSSAAMTISSSMT